MAGKDGASNIDIWLRVKPDQRASPRLVLDPDDGLVQFNMPRELSAGYINNQRENYEFRFNGILSPQAKQDEVFERVARPVVKAAMEGYNGTIFAYGQTGSGKTFTITGGPERYVDRGIIPRTISAIFGEIQKRSDYQYEVFISYLELYNEMGYDLLDPNREIKAMEDLPRVYIREKDDQQMEFKNLSEHRAITEEDALNLLFLGDTNRTISETPMNLASSRSHCIFTIHVRARKAGEDMMRTSKLNLVDLAGSERASKTGIDGTTLREAKYINLSLHYLEQVIIALQERAMGMNRPHIPYRNSMMTMVLKDSLGGNCRTVMIATASSDPEQLDESISTCRFAVRVAMVRNVVSLNEELDPGLVIRRLKQEIKDLKEEVKVLKGGEEERGPFTEDELKRLAQQVEAFCADNAADANLNLGGSMMAIRAVFSIFKQMVRSGGGGLALPASSGGGKGDPMRSSSASEASTVAGGGRKPGSAGEDVPSDAADQIRKLKLQVQQRDNEINILVSMLKRREGGRGPALPTGGHASTSGPPLQGPGAAAGPRQAWGEAAAGAPESLSAVAPGAPQDPMAALMDTSLLADRNKAFELFRKSYRQNEVIEENMALLKQKVVQAKELGAAVNDSRQRINEFKALIEQRRVQRSVAAASSGQDPEQALQQEDPEEDRCKDLIEKEKVRYKDSFNQLRDLKREIENLQLLLVQSRKRLDSDFNQYMTLLARQAQQQQQQGLGPGGVPSFPGSPQVGAPARNSQQLSMSASPSAAAAMARASQASLAGPPSAGSSGSFPSGFGHGPGPGPGTSLNASLGGYGAPSPAGSPGMMGFGPPGGAALGQVLGSGGMVGPGAGPPRAPAVGGWVGGAGAGGAAPAGQAGDPAAAALRRGMDPAVVEDARPYLTGNPDADEDILKFYAAKRQLMVQLSQQ